MEIITLENGQKMKKEVVGNTEILTPYNEPSEMLHVEPQPTLEEMQVQTLLNTEYLAIMSELSNL